ncbi:MAG: TRAP transporter small permease [Oscillospiraceae bacterium]
MKEKTIKIVEKIDSILLTISSIFLLITTVLAVCNAIIRFGRLGNLTWAEELNTILMILLVYAAQPALEMNNKQLVIGILQSSLKSEKAKRFFTILQGIITIAFTGILLFYSYKVVGTAAKFNYVTSVLFFPRKYLYGFMFVSYVTIILSWLVNIFCKHGKLGEEAVDIGVVDSSIIDKQVEDYHKAQGKRGDD